MQTVEINSLSEPTETTVVDERYLPVSGEIDIDAEYEAWWSERESIESDSD